MKILVIYHSQEKGNTKKAAELVAKGCKDAGAEVEMFNTNETRINMEKAASADGFALGSPDYYSYMAGGLKQFFDDLTLAVWAGKNVKGKPCVAFVTHGGGGSAIKSIESMINSMEMNKVREGLKISGAPSGKDAEAAMELGKTLAKAIKR